MRVHLLTWLSEAMTAWWKAALLAKSDETADECHENSGHAEVDKFNRAFRECSDAAPVAGVKKDGNILYRFGHSLSCGGRL